MTPQDIVDAITAQYNRDTRKQVVKTILQHEKDNDKEAIESSYAIINQIFSYVLAELNWEISSNSSAWDNTPLSIMSQAFPKLEATKWFNEQQLLTKKAIDLQTQ